MIKTVFTGPVLFLPPVACPESGRHASAAGRVFRAAMLSYARSLSGSAALLLVLMAFLLTVQTLPGRACAASSSAPEAAGSYAHDPGSIALADLADDIVEPPNTYLNQYWDGSDQSGNGQADGGDGQWDSSSTNWTGYSGGGREPDFDQNDSWAGAGTSAVFGNQGGTVTIEGDQHFGTLYFLADGYLLRGDGLVIAPNFGDASTIDVGEGLKATIESSLSGAGILKTGSGDLILIGVNDYSGKTEIREGRILAGSADSLSPLSPHELTGGELVLENGSQSIGGLSGSAGLLDLGSSALTVNQAESASFSASLKGDAASRLTVQGAGELSLADTEAFEGTYAVEDGATLELASQSALTLNNALAGAGLLALSAGSATDAVTLGEKTGDGLSGVLELRRGSMDLDDNAENALSNAELRLKEGGSAHVDQERSLRALSLDGGRLSYAFTDGSPTGFLTVEDLVVTDNGGDIILDLGETAGENAVADKNFYDYAGAEPQTLLVAANNTVSGSAANIRLLGSDGTDLAELQQSAIVQNGQSVGTAFFGFSPSLVSTGSGRGLYYSETLTELAAENEKTISLDSDQASSDVPRLEARLSGQGGFLFTGAKQAEVGNSASSYTGPTRVEGGNLLLISDNAFGNTASLHLDGESRVDVNGHSQTVGALSGNTGALISLGPETGGSGRLVVDSEAESRYAGSISGKGDLVKLGTGSLVLTGSNDFSGGTDVQGGILEVRGSIDNSGVTVRNNARLAVISGGTIGRSVQVGSGGSLVFGSGGTIAGDLSMADGAIIAATSNDNPLSVGGAVDLADNLQVQLAGNNWSTGSYTLLAPADAADLDGFSDIYAPGFAEEYRVTNQGGRLVLQYSERSSAGLDGNRKRVYGAVAGLDKSSSLYQSLSGINAGELGSALDKLSGEAYSSLHSNLALIDRGFSRRLSRHISQASLNRRPILVDESSYMDPGDYDRFSTYSGNYYGSRYNLWATVGGSYARVDARNGVARSTLEGPEVAVGVDALYGDGVMAGGALQYSYKDFEVEDRDSDADIHSFTVALYAGRELNVANNVLRLIMGGMYSYHNIEMSRDVRVSSLRDNLDADFNASSVRLYAEGAYSVVLAEKFHLEPFLNVGWNWLRTDSFDEDGGQAALKGSSESTDSFSSLLGVRFDLPVHETLRLYASLGWEHVYGDLDPELRLGFRAGGDSFRVKGNRLSRDELSLGLGAGLNLSENLGLNVNYDGGVGDDSQVHSGSATLIYRW